MEPELRIGKWRPGWFMHDFCVHIGLLWVNIYFVDVLRNW